MKNIDSTRDAMPDTDLVPGNVIPNIDDTDARLTDTMEIFLKCDELLQAREKTHGKMACLSDNYIAAGIDIKAERSYNVTKALRNGFRLKETDKDTLIDLINYCAMALARNEVKK